jgi:hypothetical protein
VKLHSNQNQGIYYTKISGKSEKNISPKLIDASNAAINYPRWEGKSAF